MLAAIGGEKGLAVLMPLSETANFFVKPEAAKAIDAIKKRRKEKKSAEAEGK